MRPEVKGRHRLQPEFPKVSRIRKYVSAVAGFRIPSPTISTLDRADLKSLLIVCILSVPQYYAALHQSSG